MRACVVQNVVTNGEQMLVLRPSMLTRQPLAGAIATLDDEGNACMLGAKVLGGLGLGLLFGGLWVNASNAHGHGGKKR